MMRNFRGKSVVVTGGAGFIGSHFVDKLVELGAKDIFVLDNFYLGKLKNVQHRITASNKGEGSSVIVKMIDVSNMEDVDRFFSKYNIDIIINLAVVPLLASLESPYFTVTHNVAITIAMCEMVRRGLAKVLIQFSSSGVYGNQDIKMKEFTHRIPVTPYDASKLASEEIVFSYCRTFGIDALVIRPFNTYGPRQNSGSFAGVVPTVINRMLKNKPSVIVYGNGAQTRDFIYVSDVVDITIKSYEVSEGQVINAGTGIKCSINYLIDMLTDIIGYDRTRIIHMEDRCGEINNRQSDNSFMCSLLGVSPKIDLYSGLKKTVDWYRQDLEV